MSLLKNELSSDGFLRRLFMKSRVGSMITAAAVLACSGLLFAAGNSAGSEVTIRLPLPRLFLPAPPPLVPIPGTYAYTAPDAEADIVYYQGAWYRPHSGGWYMANGYNGPWRALSPDRVPGFFNGLPPNFRRVSAGHERMPYGHVEKNWKTWEHERHWDDHGKKKGKKSKDGDDRGHGRGRDKKNHRNHD